MADRKGSLWYMVTGAAEMSWFFAWAMFSAVVILHRPFPFLTSICVYALAACLTRISMGKGWRVAQVIAAHVFGFVVAALVILHSLYYAAHPLLSHGWLAGFFSASRSTLEWIILLVNLFLIAALWALGVGLARRQKTYYAACGRFDIGLVAFLALFLVKLIMLTKGEMRVDEPFSLLFLFPFFLFSLLSIGMARMETDTPKTFLPGYRGVGIIISFGVIVLVGAGGMVLFFLPGLTAVAETGYYVLKVAGAPLGSIFVAIVRFMFMPRSSRPEPPKEPQQGIDWERFKPGPHGWWMELVEKVLGWGLWGLVVLCIVAVAGVCVFYLVKWLLSRTSASAERERPGTSVSLWLSHLWAFLVRSWNRMRCGLRGYEHASELYGALLGWARRSGFSHVRSETPLEFGVRLHSRFPLLKPDIELIIGAFNQEAYGGTLPSAAEMETARSAWRSLRSPLLWPSRLKSWFFKPDRTTISNI